MDTNLVTATLQWLRSARLNISRAGGNAEEVLKMFPDSLVEILVRNRIDLDYIGAECGSATNGCTNG